MSKLWYEAPFKVPANMFASVDFENRCYGNVRVEIFLVSERVNSVQLGYRLPF